MLCMYCLEENPQAKYEQVRTAEGFRYRCPACREELPATYVLHWDSCPICVVTAVGFRGHGKSVFFLRFCICCRIDYVGTGPPDPCWRLVMSR